MPLQERTPERGQDLAVSPGSVYFRCPPLERVLPGMAPAADGRDGRDGNPTRLDAEPHCSCSIFVGVHELLLGSPIFVRSCRRVALGSWIR